MQLHKTATKAPYLIPSMKAIRRSQTLKLPVPKPWLNCSENGSRLNEASSLERPDQAHLTGQIGPISHLLMIGAATSFGRRFCIDKTGFAWIRPVLH